MPIFRTPKTVNYTKIDNAIATAPMGFKAKDVLLFLLSKPPEWIVIKGVLCKELQLSMYIVKKSLQWLARHGYAFYKHCHTGYGSWQIFDTPQPKTATNTATAPANTPEFVIPTMAFQPPLERIETESKRATAPQTAEPITMVNVVVSLPVIIEPEPIAIEPVIEAPALVFAQIAPKEIPAAKSIIKKAPLHLQQDVLTYLAAMIIKGGVLNPMGYLTRLVGSANNGTFTVTQAAGATKPDNPNIAKTQELIRQQREINRSKPDIAKAGIAGLWAAARGAL